MTKIKICCPTAMPSLWNFLHQYVPRPLYFRRNYLVAMPWLPLWRLVLFGLIATIWWKWLLAIAAQVSSKVIWHYTTVVPQIRYKSNSPPPPSDTDRHTQWDYGNMRGGHFWTSCSDDKMSFALGGIVHGTYRLLLRYISFLLLPFAPFPSFPKRLFPFNHSLL